MFRKSPAGWVSLNLTVSVPLVVIPEMKQMGFGLAVAVLLDATIIRSVLVPASMQLLGHLNWYLPSWLEWLPQLHIEGAAGVGTLKLSVLSEAQLRELELRLDRIEPITDILRRQSLALGLDMGSVELEFGPSQVEFVFRPAQGMSTNRLSRHS